MSTSPILNSHRQLVLLIDIKNGNPQGDPDDDNCPRTDPETGKGLITAQGPKRKIRDFLAMNGHEVYVARGSCFQRTNREVATSLGINDIFGQEEEESEETDSEEETEVEASSTKKGKKGKAAKKSTGPKVKITSEMSKDVYSELAKKFIDARLFGQLVPKLNGMLRGPIQFSMGESIDPVQPARMAITRVAVATEAEEKSQGGANRGMGGLWFIPYGLYRFHIYVNPSDAQKTGCTEEDYDLFLKALVSMFDNDRSSVRPSFCVRALYEFKQKPNEPNNKFQGTMLGERLLESIQVERINKDAPARSFNDYRVHIPTGIKTSSDFEFRRVVSEKSPWEDDQQAAAE